MIPNLDDNLEDVLNGLRTLRDEIRVQLHLATMDARLKFKAIEHDLRRIESATKHATESSLQALHKNLVELKAEINK